MKITIQHQEEKTYQTFTVQNADQLNSIEVAHICECMGVSVLLINGKYYSNK